MPAPPTPARPDLEDRLRRNAVAIASLVLLVFLLYRLVTPALDGRRVAAQEREVLAVLEQIHAAELEASRGGGARLLGLLELHAAAAEDSPLAKWTTPIPSPDPAVDLLRLGDHLLALALSRPGRDQDRAWSQVHQQQLAPDERGGYAAYAWPARYGPDCQWAFFIDHRGKLLGGWNHGGALDGVEPPFPPAVHPLREYLAARKEDDDGEWFLFAAFPEIAPLAPVASAPPPGS